ncbi:MAG TPA: hypothetical protein VKD71_05140 [Gemmataceae bacterium]|nr:hypothetical protein [Gemmataceae bacterium]
MRRCLLCLIGLVIAAVASAAEKPSVVELFEDDADGLLPLLTMGGISGAEENRAAGEMEDVFSGKVALRVAPAQRFNPEIKGWSFRIAEKPKEGEYRYLRFAWKKLAPGPIMIQFCSREQNWIHRYHAGGNPPWSAKEVAAEAPGEWAVYTCDLFKDFGAFTLGGIAFTPLQGGDGLYDHVLLGRTVADLERATTATMLTTPRKLSPLRLEQIWTSLGNTDEAVATAAVWTMVAGRSDGIPFMLKTVKVPVRKVPPAAVDAETVRPLIEGLNHYRHLTREAAAEELFRLGDGVLPHLRKAAASADGEAKVRLTALLDRWAARTGPDELRLRRCATILRIVHDPDGEELLKKIEKVLP